MGFSLAAPASYVRHEQRDVQHDHLWEKREKAPADVRMPVRIALTQRNLESGHDMLMDVADPASPNYGKHWSAAEVAAMFAPSQDSIDAVSEWLKEAGVGPDRHSVSLGKHWIKFESSTAELEELLKTQYHVFSHKETGEEHIACDDYQLPHHLRSHVDFITPTVNMRDVSLKKTKRWVKRSIASLPPINLGPANVTDSKTLDSAATDTCYEGLTPACVKAAYGIADAPTSPQANNELGIFEEGDYYDQVSRYKSYFRQR